MPKIERSVAYTFDAYSGGLLEELGGTKSPRPSRRNSQVNINFRNSHNRNFFFLSFFNIVKNK